MNPPIPVIQRVDAQGADAMALLREAAIDARALYPELHRPDAPWPTNPPTPPRGVYLVAYVSGQPVACGALRPIDEITTEVRRMYVLKSARRSGLARAVLAALEREAAQLGFSTLRLETGQRQQAAMALYASQGFVRIPPFGEHVNDPFSVCFEKAVAPAA
ncbi:GNAT family N-acetyltransferase [Aquabacterium sp.]|uniref:GNAT family N-acetyltransferase n=1 Tax=Aquabacterium sp. TaxID=1872578 RepID=UPI002BA59626|nr:GNAT family N-acetyltransferase [Aquabacterium sp.]HSW03663.1 GNAT family N-acetyltransferase [Aquabacterium sp.]